MTPHVPQRYAAVLDEGLPTLPSRMQPREPLPVAAWSGERYGAVMVIEDCEHDPNCSDDEHYVVMTYTYLRTPDGWQPSRGAGGTDWPGGGFTRPELESSEVSMEGGTAGGHMEDWRCRTVAGFAGSNAHWIELREGERRVRRPMPASGAFVVALDEAGPATVTVLDADGGPLDSYAFGG